MWSHVSHTLPVFYDCLNCPSYCCSYPRIPVTKRDVRRLAKHFELTEHEASEKFTKKGWTKRERVMRHESDEIYGSACQFLDRTTRLCSVHKARPSVCSGHPDGPNCGYYNFLMTERRDQEDPKLAVRAYNLPGEFPELEED
jgi:Fe-S-cluster containining protein